MKAFLIAAIILLFASATLLDAQTYQTLCIRNLASVAHRLHVGPTKESSLLVATDCGGAQYDVVRLIQALLDRIDKAEKKNP